MMAYADVMIDNADIYYVTAGIFGVTVRKTSTGNIVEGVHDINNILKAATKCIEIIESHNKTK